MTDKPWHLHHGDCIAHMHEMERESVDMAVFSPPFPSTFSYSSSPEDLGNSEDLKHEARIHFAFFFAAIRPIIKPGRVMMVHCAQIGRLKRSGEVGLFDFRGLLIRLAIRAGFVYDYDWCITKNPQAQAIRTKKWEIKFQGLETDRAMSRGALPDYFIKFRAPGENKVPIRGEGQVTRNNWIDWAEAAWTDIKETNTLNVRGTKGEGDTKHICALQLDAIDRVVTLFSNPEEVVFSPFAGIGSEGYSALRLGRRFYGIERKDEYFQTAERNLEKAMREKESCEPVLYAE